MSDNLIYTRIVITRDVVQGKPRIAGTRVMVYQVLDMLAAGRTADEITSEDYFPNITVTDVYLCIAYASRVIQRISGDTGL